MASERQEAKYAKFVYDITQEIMQNCLYNDKDIQNVFQKHIEKNTGILEKVIINFYSYENFFFIGI